MQLVAYGAQDIYLTGNPQITFFKVVYRRHTNFSMEDIKQDIDGSSQLGKDNEGVVTISRNGDLVSKLWLDVKLPASTKCAAGGTYQNWTNNTGHAFVKDCEIEIGGQRIDRHYSQWLDVWNELTDHDESEWIGLNKHAAKNAYLKSGSAADTSGAEVTRLYVPLQFWFCRNPGLALPLIALQYHEVKVILEHDFSGFTSVADNKLWCDYIYLDTDERRRFAQVSHEYLIEQVQESTLTSALTNDLNFNHPVKELVWCADATNGGLITPLTNTYQLKLNGHDRFSARDLRYFTRTQVWEHHTGCGGLDVSTTARPTGSAIDSIAVYSFAL